MAATGGVLCGTLTASLKDRGGGDCSPTVVVLRRGVAKTLTPAAVRVVAVAVAAVAVGMSGTVAAAATVMMYFTVAAAGVAASVNT